MSNIDQDLEHIRHAIYGREVREAIADGIEQCYNDSTANTQIALINEKAEEAIQAIENKGEETRQDIPDSYTDLNDLVHNLENNVLNRNYSDAILESAGFKPIPIKYKGYYTTPNAGEKSVWTTHTNWWYGKGKANPGDILNVSGYASSSIKLVAWLDANDNVISSFTNTSFAKSQYVAPNGTVSFVININNASMRDYKSCAYIGRNLIDDAYKSVKIDEFGTVIPINIEPGSISSSDGSHVDDLTRARTAAPIPWDNDYIIVLSQIKSYTMFFLIYDSNHSVLYSSTWAEYGEFVNSLGYLDLSIFNSLNPDSFDIVIGSSNGIVDCNYISKCGLLIKKNSNESIFSKKEKTRNVWLHGTTVSFTRYKTYQDYIPAGTYCFSAKVTSSDTQRDYSLVCFYYSQEAVSGNGVFLNFKRGVRESYIVTFEQPVRRIYLYASSNSTTSLEDIATFEDIQLEEGYNVTPFTKNVSAVDEVVRTDLSGNTFLLPPGVYTGERVIQFEIPAKRLFYETPIVSCDAKFTRAEGVLDYPRITLSITTDRNYVRNTTYYMIGRENRFFQQEWRAPAYFWDGRPVKVTIRIPTGCELTIKSIRYRFDSSITRTTGGLYFFARPGSCGITPDLSMSALQIAYRHGYNAFTVIPKVSSDGVWYAYHDDTWDPATTPLRNADGSAITSTEYTDQVYRFHEIPFSYLDQYVLGGLHVGKQFEDEKIMKLEDYFEFIAKTGMAPRFSLHPAIGVNAKLGQVKQMLKKYGLLNKLTVIVNDIQSVFNAFGNDIAGYCFPNTSDSTPDGTKRMDAGYTSALDAKTRYGITTGISCGLWASGIFDNKEYAKTLIGNILDSGFEAEVFTIDHTGIDGTSHNALWSEDIRWLASIGVTKFTEANNTSNGLNW